MRVLLSAEVALTDKRDIAGVVGHYKNKGLFTHAFVARGRLADAKPFFIYKDYADSDDIFDLASLTKALVMTPLLFRWRDRSGLRFDQTVGDWLGRVSLALDQRIKDLSVRRLLAHTSGLPAWRNFWMCWLDRASPSTNKNDLLKHELEVLSRAAADISGTSGQNYSDIGFVVLGLLMEAVAGESLDKLFDDFCVNDLNLASRGYVLGFPRSHPEMRAFISTGMCLIRGRQLRGEVHDENCAALGGVTGHAGLFGSGESVCAYISALAQSSVGRCLLAENAAARQLPLQIPVNEGLLGWRQAATVNSLPFGNGAAMGHLGFTGCAFWVWPETGEYVTLLTNRVISGRTSPEISAMRREVFTVLAAL
jgi:CubicO group peptidase (beta-lactamase class C family)